MRSTFLSFLRLLHSALSPQSEPSSPADFIIPDFHINIAYDTSLEDEGKKLVASIVSQYIRIGFGQNSKGELAKLQNREQHFLLQLRLPHDFSRIAGQTIVLTMSPWCTPLEAVQKAIDFVSTDFISLTHTIVSPANRVSIHQKEPQ